MRNWFSRLIAVIIILGALSPAALTSAEAQTPPPPPEPERRARCLPGQPCEDDNGERFMLPTEETLAEPAAIGDTDDYGYTITSTTYSWIDATGGTNTGINDTWDITAAISLPWAFPFYGNSYSQLYITGAGYAAFEEGNVSTYFDIPEESEPNNLISVLTKHQYYSSSAVWYRNYGTHFVIQWNNMKDYDGGTYTFEAVLYPDGNIKFQYKTLPDTTQGWYCSTTGIENASGLDGLVFWDRCESPTTSSTAVLFTRPGPSARVGASPLYLGEFASSLDVDDFSFTLTNTGNLGADTYDMLVTTAPLGGGWTAELFDKATGLPLTDTDADGSIDSGLLGQGASKEILVRVSAPAGLALGANIKTYVDVTSSLNTGKTKTITIESTVPAPFAQTYQDVEEEVYKTDLIWPVLQNEVEIPTEPWNVQDPAIIETPEHNFVHVWTDYDWNGANTNGWVLRYAVIDRFGVVVKEPTLLSPMYDVAGYNTGQWQTALAVAPDGKVGVVWQKSIGNPAGLENQNTWFAVLSSTGSLIYGPVNLTNDNSWGSYQNGNMVQMFEPDISASADNRFMITWVKSSQATDIEDIYYTIRQCGGAEVVPVTKMTASTSTSWFYPRVQIALSGNRFFIAYIHNWINGQYYDQEQLYRVFDSSGGTLTPPTNLNFPPSAGVQLSGGNILMAFTATNGTDHFIAYGILNGTNYALINSGQLSHPSISNYTSSLSVTKDANNRGILTWSDENQRYLYYALVSGSNGAVLTNPVIFHRSDRFELSYNGSGITTNSWSPAAGVDLSARFTSELFGGTPGGMASLWLDFMNIGAATSSATQLVLTLPDGLSYASDSSGLVPVVVGNTVSWALPDMPYGAESGFQVWVYIDGGAAAGTLFPVSLEISSGSADANPADNTDSAQVLAGLMHFLPTLFR
jgi:hypothetical protein